MRLYRLKRREFITLLSGAAAGWLLPLSAQEASKVHRIGFLRFGSASGYAGRVEALRAGLRQLGYAEGKNIVIEFRWAETVDQLPELAVELVRMNVDVIFAMSSTEVEAVRQVTKTIPIVFATHADPVGLGHVASLSRPGGNITGLTTLLSDLAPKELEILKEVVPNATRIGVLYSLTAPSHRPALEAIETAGQKLGVPLRLVPVRTAEDLDEAFAMMVRERVGACYVVSAPIFGSHRARLAELALKHRLPATFGNRENVEAGGLMSYSADFNDMMRRAAIYIDKILKGVKPADLPVEQASKYELIINLKTAKAIGLTLSEAFLLRADKVIE
jgi:putative tryptophan/tyrosine transport system substrate-binding protein